MKLKKEYLVLAAVIIAAVFYLILHKKDQTQYSLPELAEIDIDTVTRIAITAQGKTITLNKNGDRWFLAPREYPADGAKVKGMLFEIEDIVITDLVSESRAYARYQLDDAGKIRVKAWAGEELLRDLEIGKEAATYQHTFVRLPESPNVYHVRGDFRRKFEESAADLRDHEVLAFDPDALEKIRLTSGPDTFVMTRRAAPQSDQAGDKPVETAKPAWTGPDSQSVDSGVLDSFLSSINNIKCENYLEGRQKDEFEGPVFEIALEGKQSFTLALFKKEKEKETVLPATSSYNAYPFTLSNDRLESWQKTFAKLTGKEEKQEENKK